MKNLEISHKFLMGLLIISLMFCLSASAGAQFPFFPPVPYYMSAYGYFPPVPFYSPAYAFTPSIQTNPFTGYAGILSSPLTSPVPVPPVPPLVRRAATTTLTLALPSPALATAALPVAPAPLISTTQLFLALLLQIGEHDGWFYTNPAAFWYVVGLLY